MDENQQTGEPMSWLVTIDPSLSCSGWSVFHDGVMTGCGYIRTDKKHSLTERLSQIAVGASAIPDMPEEETTIIIEWPQVYRGKVGPNPNDLLKVSAAGACFLSSIPHAKSLSYLPREWKKSLPKEKMNDLVEAALSTDEHLIFSEQKLAKRNSNNVLDAIGIALFQLGRFVV